MRLAALGLAAAAFGCGPAAGTATLRSSPPAETALNGTLGLRADAAIDPLCVTERSVSVRREDGRPLAASLGTAAGALVIELEVTPALLAEPPAAAIVRLQGAPSPHALRTTDGRPLGDTVELRWPLLARLHGSGGAPRLVSVNGRPLPLAEVQASGSLRLGFDGVLDPATISPETCPLWPREHGLTLKEPLRPPVSWRCVGERFELILDLAGARGELRLQLASFGVRGLSGRGPEPPLQLEVRAS